MTNKNSLPRVDCFLYIKYLYIKCILIRPAEFAYTIVKNHNNLLITEIIAHCTAINRWQWKDIIIGNAMTSIKIKTFTLYIANIRYIMHIKKKYTKVERYRILVKKEVS